jgi:DNA-binding PucR family transcriptional regulator
VPPDISPRVRELIRRGAEQALDPPATWFGEVEQALFGSPVGAQIAADPELAASARRAILSTLTAWVLANVHAPGEPVAPDTSDAPSSFARDLVRRGWDDVTLDAYRAGQDVAWRHWMEIAFGLTSEPTELRALLEVTAASISRYVGSTIDAVAAQMRRERTALADDVDAARRETVALVLRGAPISSTRAEQRLGYPVGRSHHAAVVWTEAAEPDVVAADRVCEVLAGPAGTERSLRVRASTGTWWLWSTAAPDLVAVGLALTHAVELRVALAGPAAGVAGFRRAHLDALTAQRMVGQLASDRSVTHHDDVALVSLMTQDPDAAGRFVDATLGDLAGADVELRATLRAYIAAECNTTRAAVATYTHRNTFTRRLEQARSLLPAAGVTRLADVAAALELLAWTRPRP